MKKDVIDPEVITPGKSGSHRNKAYQIRAKQRAGDPVSPEDLAWLLDYEAAQKSTSTGASASRRVSYTEEESAAVGTGAAAEVAAAGALAREEGRRIDYLLQRGMEAMQTAFNMQAKMCDQLMRDNHDLKEVQMAMLETVRAQYLARTQAEVDLMQSQADANRDEKKDAISEMVEAMAPALMAKVMEAKK